MTVETTQVEPTDGDPRPVPTETSERLLGGRVRHVLARLGRHLVSTYLTFDPRSLGLFRIVIGSVLLIDLFQRYRGVDYWYTDAALVPTHLVKTIGFEYNFSLFLHASTHGQAVFGMALCAVVYVLFTIGLGTRLAHVLSILAVVSLNNRLFLLENSGHAVLNLLLIWSAFLPLGRRFSVDAVLAARRARRRGAVPDPAAFHRPVVSLAVLGLLLQFSAIYWFSVVQKTGPNWWNGSAVHYALHDERMNTALAVWIRENAPRVLLEGMSWGTLVVEALAVVFFLSPLWPRHLRLAAVLSLPALHAGFALCLTLGIFSFAMISFYPLLIAPEHWDWIERRFLPHRHRDVANHASAGKATRARRSWLGYGALGLREALILLFAAACIGDLAINNPAFPRVLKFEQPKLFHAIVWYPRIRQFWLMFTPQPPDTVIALAVEAVTEDGRTVDPYNEVASRYPALPRGNIPPHLDQNQPFSDYTVRMPQKDFTWCRMAFANWVLAYPARTGNPADRIVSFQAFIVRSRIPPLGSTEFGRPVWERFFAFP